MGKKDRKVIIIGGGLAGCECASTLLDLDYDNFVLLEKNNSPIRVDSWKTFDRVIKKFELEDFVFQDVNRIFLRTVDIDSLRVIEPHDCNISCKVLDSTGIYRRYAEKIGDHMRNGENVVKITRESDEFIVVTEAGNKYRGDIIVDASGPLSITERLYFGHEFVQRAFYTCYAKRFKNCKADKIRHTAFFDFDSSFKLFGTWCYPIDDNTAEIGVARLVNFPELEIGSCAEEVDALLDRYMKMEPYNEVFDGAEYVTTIKGYAPLLPRLKIFKDNVYFAGATKGTVPYSGYGVENALESGRAVAESIALGKKYKYFVTPPAKGLAILTLLWNAGTEEVRRIANAVGSMSDADLNLFYSGDINLGFFIRATKVCMKNKINSLAMIRNPGLVFRALFNLKPKPKDYRIFAEKLDKPCLEKMKDYSEDKKDPYFGREILPGLIR